ncbi:MAG: hypothetical protein E7255_02580 [Lachnospiraceae bacterium]|nr:hypothetical protein [Lachnospiraceae bacterium]
MKKIALLLLSCIMLVSAPSIITYAKDSSQDTIIFQSEDTTIGYRTPLIQPRGYNNQEWYVVKDAGAGYSVEVGALVEMAVGGGHSNFHEVLDKWSVASGSGSYTWSPSYVSAELVSSTELRLMSSGYIEVAIDVSETGSVGADLEFVNFERGKTIGSTTYYRKRISVDERIKLSYQ